MLLLCSRLTRGSPFRFLLRSSPPSRRGALGSGESQRKAGPASSWAWMETGSPHLLGEPPAPAASRESPPCRPLQVGPRFPPEPSSKPPGHGELRCERHHGCSSGPGAGCRVVGPAAALDPAGPAPGPGLHPEPALPCLPGRAVPSPAAAALGGLAPGGQRLLQLGLEASGARGPGRRGRAQGLPVGRPGRGPVRGASGGHQRGGGRGQLAAGGLSAPPPRPGPPGAYLSLSLLPASAAVSVPSPASGLPAPPSVSAQPSAPGEGQRLKAPSGGGWGRWGGPPQPYSPPPRLPHFSLPSQSGSPEPAAGAGGPGPGAGGQTRGRCAGLPGPRPHELRSPLETDFPHL